MLKRINRFEAYEKDKNLYLFVKNQDDEVIYARDGLENEEGMLSLMAEVLRRYELENSGVIRLSEGLADKNTVYETVKKDGILVADQDKEYINMIDQDKIPAAYKELSDKNFYFTFGKEENMPYQDGYLIVKANNIYTALDLYQINHPNIHPGIVNCTFYYGYPQWEKDIKQFYADIEPKEIITKASTMSRYGTIEYTGVDADRDSLEEDERDL